MRRASFFALVFSLTLAAFGANARAQGWRWVSPKPQGVAVNAVAFFSTRGWYVGAAGTIATTADGAANFSPEASGVSVDLFGVFFQSAKNGWAVGDLGTILATQDGGNTWVQQSSGTTRRLHGVWFTDALHGLAVGDFRTLLQTADGGQTWTGRGTSALSLDAVTFTDALHGFICGDGGVVVLTTDGGNTFTAVQTPSSAHLLALSFADLLHGFAVGEGGAVVATSDGGQTWTAQTVGTDDLVAVMATSSTQAYALGASGELNATADGSTWTVVGQLGAGGLFTALVQEPRGGAWDATAQSGQWLRAPAGGTPPSFPAFADVNDLFSSSQTIAGVAFGSVDAGVMVSGRYLYATQDRGLHIAQVGPPSVDGGQAFGWNGVSASSATDVYAVGIQGTAAVSHDQGQTWALLSVGTGEDLEAVQFLPDSGIGYAVGAGGTIASTVNGGASWSLLTPVSSVELTALAFFDPQHGVVGGQDGALQWTLDGKTVQAAGAGFYGTVTGLVYPASGVTIVCAADGTLAHSTNQGITYYALSTPPVTKGFGALAFTSRQNGWVAGNGPNGDIWGSSDGAQSFALQFSGSSSLMGFSFVDAIHGYAVGAGGTLLATDTAGGAACTVDSDCADAGYAGITCAGGACLPCTTDDRCGPACTACASPTPYCYGGYCGACESDTQCLPGYCVLGQCQMSSPTAAASSSSGGTTNGASTSSSGAGTGATGASGSSGATASAGSTGLTGSCPPGEYYCQTASCSCGSSRGNAVWTVLLLGLLALRRSSRARR